MWGLGIRGLSPNRPPGSWVTGTSVQALGLRLPSSVRTPTCGFCRLCALPRGESCCNELCSGSGLCPGFAQRCTTCGRDCLHWAGQLVRVSWAWDTGQAGGHTGSTTPCDSSSGATGLGATVGHWSEEQPPSSRASSDLLPVLRATPPSPALSRSPCRSRFRALGAAWCCQAPRHRTGSPSASSSGRGTRRGSCCPTGPLAAPRALSSCSGMEPSDWACPHLQDMQGVTS